MPEGSTSIAAVSRERVVIARRSKRDLLPHSPKCYGESASATGLLMRVR